MSVKITQPIPPNVVEIGNEITQAVVDGLMSANPSPSSSNPYVTKNLLDGKLSLTGGTLTGSVDFDGASFGDKIGLSAVATDGNSYSGFDLNTDDASQGANLKITFGNIGEEYEHATFLNQQGLLLSDSNNEYLTYLSYYGLECAVNSANTYFNINGGGVGGHDSNNFPWILNPSSVEGTYDGTHWGIGTSGVVFPDSTIQTTAATAPDLTPYLQKSDNLASLTSASTARTNLGLTSLATSSFATSDQVIAGTSTTTVVNPSTLIDNKYMAGGRSIGYLTWTAATSGTGASAGNLYIKSINAPTTASGYGQSYIASQNNQRGQIYNNGIDFTKNIVFGGRFCRLQSGTIDSNSIFRCNLGRSVPISSAGDLSSRGVGIRIVGNTGVLELQVHNGTTLYNVSSTFTPVYNQAFDVVITVNGGVATLYVNGTSVATSSNAPTTLLTANFSVLLVECQNTTTISNAPYQMNCSDQFLHISPV